MQTPGKEEQGIFVAFLFDADHISFTRSRVYGAPSEQALIDAIAAVDRGHTIRTRVRRGDVLADFMAQKLGRLVVAPDSGGGGKRLSMGMHQRVDRRTLATLIGDVVDSFRAQWQTVDLVDLPRRFGRTNVYCLSMSPVLPGLAKLMDGKLRSYGPYIGAVQVDPGNPIHRRLFAELPDCVYFDSGTIYRSRWNTDEGVNEFGRQPGKHFRVTDLSYWDFQRAAPRFPMEERGLSERGAESAKRLEAVTEPSHFEAVANALIDRKYQSATVFPVDFKVMPPDDEQLEVPVTKLLDYALNSEHATGRHKARLFSDLLGIVARDWRYLAYQIKRGINLGRLEKARVTEHGVQYTVLMRVVGLNGKTCTVVTAWIIRPEGAARLVTAYPADKSKQRTKPGMAPPWIDPLLRGDQRWCRLHSLAEGIAKTAGADYVPTPMQAAGYGVILDGMCGGAFVRLNGRTSFARWLVANGLAWKGYPSGIRIPACTDSQSVEKAYAYATAYREVLWLNGIDGAVAELYLD